VIDRLDLFDTKNSECEGKEDTLKRIHVSALQCTNQQGVLQMQAILDHLNNLIETGSDFDDAVLATANKFKVSIDGLTIAYDKQFSKGV
jgi:hypothetical protein